MLRPYGTYIIGTPLKPKYILYYLALGLLRTLSPKPIYLGALGTTPGALMAAIRICGLGGRDARSGMPWTSVRFGGVGFRVFLLT